MTDAGPEGALVSSSCSSSPWHRPGDHRLGRDGPPAVQGRGHADRVPRYSALAPLAARPDLPPASAYYPGDLRSTSYAGLNGGYSVRRHVIADLRAMASGARAAGRALAVQSAFRSYATQKSTFAYWVRVHGYGAFALKESARAGHSEHQLGTTVDFRAYGGSAPWDYRGTGARPRRAPG